MPLSAKSDPRRRDSTGPECTILGLMAKFWAPGKVKTRLAASIGRDLAASLHRCFVAHLCQNLADVGDRRQVAFTPAIQVTAMASSLPGPWEFRPQSEGDLGVRMWDWFASALVSADSRAILIGADCPDLTSAEINHAFLMLDECDVVLGPASDGGYYLIGIRGQHQTRHRELFNEVPWSSGDEFEITRKKIERFGWSLGLLAEKSDVDEIDDLVCLRQRLANSYQIDPSHAELADEIDRLLGDVASGANPRGPSA